MIFVINLLALAYVQSRVSLRTCPEATINFVRLPETVINENEREIGVTGECVANAVPTYRGRWRPHESKCRANWNGKTEWLTNNYFPGSFCHCKTGYQPDPIKNNTCTACPIGQFKPGPGEDPCQQCPPYTKGLLPGLDECPCITGYQRYRENVYVRAMCSRPPSSPRNLTLKKVQSTTAILSWSRPLDNGNRNDTRYRVSCDTCGSWVAFNPGTKTFQQTSVSIKNLYPETSYRFLVFSENGISDLVEEEPKFAEIRVVTTESHPVLSKRLEELELEDWKHERELEHLKHQLEDLKHEQKDFKNFVKMKSGWFD